MLRLDGLTVATPLAQQQGEESMDDEGKGGVRNIEIEREREREREDSYGNHVKIDRLWCRRGRGRGRSLGGANFQVCGSWPWLVSVLPSEIDS